MTDDVGPVHFIANAAGTRLGLHCYAAGRKPRGVALLAHGTFSNHRSCRGLAQYLADNGVEAWVLDCQGHGVSERPVEEPDFESMYLLDARAALEFLQRRYPDQSLGWVGHSGGGLAILMLLARCPEYRDQLGSIVTIASQATDAAVRLRHRCGIHLAAIATRVVGFVPGRLFGLGPENEFAAVMQQWYRWSLSGRWLGRDGFDYEAGLRQLPQRCLMLAAQGDRFIAPVSGCERLFQAMGSSHKRFQVCGTATGFTEDYSHARIISSRNAAREVWPQVLAAL